MTKKEAPMYVYLYIYIYYRYMSPAPVPVPTHPPQRDDPAYDRNHDDHVAQSIHETRLVQRASGPNHIHTEGWGRWSSWNAFVLPAFTDYTLVTFHWVGVGVVDWWTWYTYTHQSSLCLSSKLGQKSLTHVFFDPRWTLDARRTPSDEPLHWIDAMKADDFIAEQRAAMLCRAGSVGLGRSTTYTVWSRPLTAASSRGICRDSRVGVVDDSLWVVTVVFHW